MEDKSINKFPEMDLIKLKNLFVLFRNKNDSNIFATFNESKLIKKFGKCVDCNSYNVSIGLESMIVVCNKCKVASKLQDIFINAIRPGISGVIKSFYGLTYEQKCVVLMCDCKYLRKYFFTYSSSNDTWCSMVMTCKNESCVYYGRDMGSEVINDKIDKLSNVVDSDIKLNDNEISKDKPKSISDPNCNSSQRIVKTIELDPIKISKTNGEYEQSSMKLNIMDSSQSVDLLQIFDGMKESLQKKIISCPTCLRVRKFKFIPSQGLFIECDTCDKLLLFREEIKNVYESTYLIRKKYDSLSRIDKLKINRCVCGKSMSFTSNDEYDCQMACNNIKCPIKYQQMGLILLFDRLNVNDNDEEME